MPRKKIVGILLHVLFIITIVVVVIFVMPLKHEKQPQNRNLAILVFTLLQTGAFYFTAYYLHPCYLKKRRIGGFVWRVSLLSLVIALQPGLTLYYLDPIFTVPKVLANVVVMFFVGIFVMGSGSSYRFIVDFFREQQTKQETLANELSFLRSQVSPHFMFNTLNSLVSLARKQSDKLEPALMKMSGLMHYMLYDSDEELVSLEQEINYIQSYIDLQTMRFGSSVPILFSVNQQGHYHSIEPMLLIPLIENAFKHGTSIINEPEINIQLDIVRNGMTLRVLNHCDETSSSSTGNAKGIGISNLKKRLEILYPGRHQFNCEKRPGKFIATLSIQLYHDQMSGH
jgi:hypothetical protein